MMTRRDEAAEMAATKKFNAFVLSRISALADQVQTELHTLEHVLNQDAEQTNKGDRSP